MLRKTSYEAHAHTHPSPSRNLSLAGGYLFKFWLLLEAAESQLPPWMPTVGKRKITEKKTWLKTPSKIKCYIAINSDIFV